MPSSRTTRDKRRTTLCRGTESSTPKTRTTPIKTRPTRTPRPGAPSSVGSQLIAGGVRQSPLYLFYGIGISYFFVSDVELSEGASQLEDSRSNALNSPRVTTHLTPQNRESALQSGEDGQSSLYRPTRAKQIGDKGLQITHRGLQVRQIILARLAEDYLHFLRQFSSSSLSKMKKYFKKSNKKFKRDSAKPIKTVSNVLVLVENGNQTQLGSAQG